MIVLVNNRDKASIMTDFRSKLSGLSAPVIIGIAGDSGSGKTTYSNGIRRLLGAEVVKTITMDGYHKENRVERKQSGKLPLDPEANNLDLLHEHLKNLKQGNPISVPIYNHKTGDFDKPVSFASSPIIIIEGLHALYPEFLPYYDFTIYVDPCREVKWQWKKLRDIKKRGHEETELMKEMLRREAAYKRWIDFQKTDANVVIKVYPSKMKEFAKYELIENISSDSYKVELIIEPAEKKLSNLLIPLDLSRMLDTGQLPFLLAVAPSIYWGKQVIAVHIDGVLSQKTIETLENHIVAFTKIPAEKMLDDSSYSMEEHEQITAVQFAQLVIGWRFLEQISYRVNNTL